MALRPLRGYERCFLVQCQDCDFVFVQRIPSEAELKEHYTRVFAENNDGYEWLSPITTKRFYEWLAYLEAYRKQNRLLDVGCGVGHFLKHAIDKGWNAYGTEYPDNAVEICRRKGIRMHSGPLDAANYPPESFDAITWLGVIEHITKPVEDLEKMHALLRPGGVLYITTPNFNSVSRTLLGPKWNVIMYPEHLSYYTVPTITRLLERQGFRKVTVAATGFSFSRVTASLKSQPVKYISPDCTDERLRVALEGNPVLLRAKRFVNSLLTATSRGDELTLIFQKPA
jgi:2-polyprenyl-3-methyl-5-hydroxy-6-metoxy-1,4-benzoquinol methylase